MNPRSAQRSGRHPLLVLFCPVLLWHATRFPPWLTLTCVGTWGRKLPPRGKKVALLKQLPAIRGRRAMWTFCAGSWGSACAACQAARPRQPRVLPGPGSPSQATTSSWQPWSNAVFIHRHASVAMRALVPCRAATVGGCTLLDGALRRTDTDTLCAPAWHSMNGEHSARASLCPRSVLRPSDMGSLCGGEGTADTQGTVHDATPSKSTGGINRAMGQDERHPNRHLHGGPSRTGMGQWST